MFIEAVALNYFFAFASLALQVKGLYGSKGITPIADFLSLLRTQFGKALYLKVPTLFWLNSSDLALVGLCWSGMVASIFVMLGFLPIPLLIFLWLAYLSFMSTGSPFLSFQWDCLLLEVGFAAIFFAWLTPPPALMLILLWVILFKLMFSSGVVKWVSRCPEWCGLKALNYHFETQPLPNRIAYYMSHLPQWVLRMSTIGVFFLEIVVPFFIFGPTEVRFLGFCLLIFLQALIFLTGNYAFFNTLTIALCLPLLLEVQVPDELGALYVALSTFAFLMIVVNACILARLFVPLPRFDKLWDKLMPFYLSNSYGLFARMTTERDEIIVEGSMDGVTWKSYEFKWKPGDLSHAPQQVAPHQPRLDWQMWFAALSPYRYNDWYVLFLQRLLEGSKDVEALLRTNPFPNEPPKYIRGQFFQYRFSSMDSRGWWTRTYKGIYSPTMRLT